MTADMSETALERLICEILTGDFCEPPGGPTAFEPNNSNGGVGWRPGNYHDYDRQHCIDVYQLTQFLSDSQPNLISKLFSSESNITNRRFLSRLQVQISQRGTIDVLRTGIKHGEFHIDLFCGTPSTGNISAKRRFDCNRFSVTRQLRYSSSETQRALDIVLFINGLPVFTFELKNSITKQTVHDAERQYQLTRNPNELLFEFGRCVAHFALDDHEIRFCTHLIGRASKFLPFNKGWNDGAGNPPNPNKIKTSYLFSDILARNQIADILENYAQIIEIFDDKKKKNTKSQIWPRYHQIDVVRSLLKDVTIHGAGKRYLIQHSAGSGKSNSIAWLAHNLINVRKNNFPIFHSIFVITDRVILDKQIRDTIRQFSQIGAMLSHAQSSNDLRHLIESEKKIIISTVQKFPLIVNEIGNSHRARFFAIIIDEAHSSQGGETSIAMTQTLSNIGQEENENLEDLVNRIMESRKFLTNASYFAFTATPKNSTLEMFGVPDPQSDGAVEHRPFHSYTMKQAIEEGFILDVLKNFVPVQSFYKLAKIVEDDPTFDTRRAHGKLRRFVENHEHAVRLKAEIIVDHFQNQVLAQKKIGGEARAMVVASSIFLAIEYFFAIKSYLKNQGSSLKAIIAFSGEHEYGGGKVTETQLNGFSSSKIISQIRIDPYRFLICADKFQTGYDEPLLHSMYVDKPLSGINAVQTLSRLNRSHPNKYDVFILDFQNDVDVIKEAFSPYYRTTVLADEADPNQIHDLQENLDKTEVYTAEQVDKFVKLYLEEDGREKLDPILDECTAMFNVNLDDDSKVAFKRNAKRFVRVYSFLSSVLPYNNSEWEKRAIFFNFLVPKLMSSRDEDLSIGILNAVDMDSYRVERKAVQSIALADKTSSIDPVSVLPASGGRGIELDSLSVILERFNELFGDIDWEDADRVRKLIGNKIASEIAEDTAFKNARENSDKENAFLEHGKALDKVILNIMDLDTQLFRMYMDNEPFRDHLRQFLFDYNYNYNKDYKHVNPS